MASTTTPAAAPERQPAHRTIDEFERRYGRFGQREQRELPILIEEVRDSGAGDGQFTVRGHAAVFDKWSLDLGGFREKIAPGAFDDVLSRDTDTWLLWDHDTRYVLARTRNKTLELRIDPQGMHYWGRVAPTSYAADLRVLMDRRDVDQASFAFTVARDEWKITGEGDNERVERTILEVGDLFDVTITAMGAYPQTDSHVVRERALGYATETGRLPGGADAAERDAGGDTDGAPPEGDAPNGQAAPDTEPVGEETEPSLDLAGLKARSRQAVSEAKERHILALRELKK